MNLYSRNTSGFSSTNTNTSHRYNLENWFQTTRAIFGTPITIILSKATVGLYTTCSKSMSVYVVTQMKKSPRRAMSTYCSATGASKNARGCLHVQQPRCCRRIDRKLAASMSLLHMIIVFFMGSVHSRTRIHEKYCIIFVMMK